MFLLEGNIGVGKSTFLRLLIEHLPTIDVSFEPLQQWQQEHGSKSLLHNFYQMPQRWAYTMEINTMLSRLQEQMHEQGSSKIIERSLYSGYCFAYNSYKSSFLTTLEWKLYLQLFNNFVLRSCTLPQGFIYLRVDPEVTYERIKKRDRDAEKTISFEYIQQIHECHENLLIHKVMLPELKDIPTLVLDANEDFESNPDQFLAHMESVKEFLQTHSYGFDSALVRSPRAGLIS